MACSHEMNVVKYIINKSLNKFLGEKHKQQSQLSSGQAEEEVRG